ncbi:energy transducer TonB [Novosphingobium sp. M1R2S20]|uniref:Protein TonB n=1 Tax=Novosphingobium rhizovicinum TaxID=3228928 RepID=A0ABV3RCR8_9SPHN
MATLASAVPNHETRPSQWHSPRPLVPVNDATDPAAGVPYERGHYAPSRRSGPVAVIASAGVMLAALAALATINVIAKHEAPDRLTVVALKQLDVTPPPSPPAKKLDTPVEQPAPVFVPKPRIELPSPGPRQVALDAPPPVEAMSIAIAKPLVQEGPAGEANSHEVSAAPADGGDLSSKVLSAQPPAYPLESRRRREQGTVKLLVLVGPDGRVSDIEIAGSSGSQRLDKAALSAVRRWRWAPLEQNGQGVAVRGYVTIPFVLV